MNAIAQPTNIRNLQDLLDNLGNLGYSKSVVGQIRPQIKKCTRVYRQPLSRIPADYDAFCRDWGTGRVGALAKGFESHDDFVEWRRRVRSALSKIAVKPVGVLLLSDWQTVLEFVIEHSGPGCLFGPHREHGLRAVAKQASARGLTPQEMTQAGLDALLAPVVGKDRRTFRRGVDTLSEVLDKVSDADPIRRLLPSTPFLTPTATVSKACMRRRGGPLEATALWAEFDRFVALKRGADATGRPVPAESSTFKARTAETYANAICTAIGLLERTGDIASNDHLELSDVCCLTTIERFVVRWQNRALHSEVDGEASTMHLAVERLSHIACYLGYPSKKERKKLGKLRDKVRKATKRRAKMSRGRENWIKAFARDTRQQLAVHTMPEKLVALAQPILDDWDNLKRLKQHKRRMHALKLGIAAAQAAILFRGSCVRAGNLRSLPFRGPEAQLLLGADDGSVQISIPAELVKNGVPVEADGDDDAGPVIEWYLREIRPRLIDDHPYGHNLADGDWLFPGSEEERPMEETVFAGHYRTGVQAVGLDMTLHQARHITAYLILAEDPNAWAEAAAVLCIEVSTLKAHYAWLDLGKAQAKGRELASTARAKARKTRKGTRT